MITLIKKEILTKPGFIRITNQGVICWFSYFRTRLSDETGNHVMVVCGEVPDKPRGKIFEQIKEAGGYLIVSNFQEEAINYGKIIDRFDLSGRETLINCIYFTSGHSMIRVIEKPDGKFLVENWGKIPRNPDFFQGTGISKIRGQTIIIYNGLEQKEFGPFGSGIFCNSIIMLSGQTTLPIKI